VKLFGDFKELLGMATLGEFMPWLAWVDTLMGLEAKERRTSFQMYRDHDPRSLASSGYVVPIN